MHEKGVKSTKKEKKSVGWNPHTIRANSTYM